jgi:N-terminal acetyltransferase B complex catalytic subunit
MSICPRMRGTGLARVFMAILERLSSDGSAGWPGPEKDPADCVDAWFVDLFVRCNNHRAIDMYEKLGYSVYRRVVE